MHTNNEKVEKIAYSQGTYDRATRFQYFPAVAQTNMRAHYSLRFEARIKHIGTEHFTPLQHKDMKVEQHCHR